MAALPAWDDLIDGRGCPLCTDVREADNEYHVHVADLSVSSLYLERDQTYRGYCVLIFNPRHATGLETLTQAEHAAFSADLHRAATAITAAVKPNLMNYATLGNVIPHLHYHLIPRYQNDPRWGAPVWVTKLADMQKTALSESDLLKLRDDLRAQLQK